MQDSNVGSDEKSFDTFYGLVKDLSDKEKKSLLNKLLKVDSDSKNPSLNNEDQSISKIDERVALEKYAKRMYNSYVFFHKIFIWLEGFFRGLLPEDVIINNELMSYKKELSTKYGKFFLVADNKLKPGILEKIIPLMTEINTIKSIVSDYFEEKVNYYDFIVFVIESANEEDLRECLKLLSPDTLDNKPEFLERVNYYGVKEQRIKNLFAQLNNTKYYEISKELIQFDLFQRIIEYEYIYLTDLFNYKMFNQPYTNCNEIYINHDIIEFFERFYRLIISLDLDILNLPIMRLFFEYLKGIYSYDIDVNTKLETCKESVVKVVNLIIEIKTDIPFESFIRYFSGNILKVVKPYNSKINFLEMYKAYKRTIIDKLWESQYSIIKSRSVTRLVNSFFGDYKFDSLIHFDTLLMERLEKYSGIKIRDYYTLNLLDKFASSVYQQKILPVINKIIIDGVFVKDIIKSNFTTAYYTLNTINEKINLFDIEFKEDSMFRKKINNTLIKIVAEPNLKSILYNLIADINDMSHKVKFEGIEAIKIMINLFRSLRDDKVGSTKILANSNSLKMPLYANPAIAFEKIDELLTTFMHIYLLVEESF